MPDRSVEWAACCSLYGGAYIRRAAGRRPAVQKHWSIAAPAFRCFPGRRYSTSLQRWPDLFQRLWSAPFPNRSKL